MASFSQQKQETSPTLAQTAQIPLQSFALPTFPPESLSQSSNLKHLILTSDINPSEYTSILSPPSSTTAIPELPPHITSLTLELFSLGYPPGFLSSLAKKLPNLNSLTIYSQLFAGTTKESNTDALTFLSSPKLREIHLLDVFFPSGFLTEVKSKLGKEIRFLEVSYTFRHSEIPGEFLRSLNAKEVLGLIEGREGMVGVNFGIREPDVVVDDEDDREGTEEGVLVVGGEGDRVVKSLSVKGAGELRLVDLSMFELTSQEIGNVLDKCENAVVVGFSVGLGEKGWEGVFEHLGVKERGVEVLELVGVPSEEVLERIKSEGVGVRKEMVEKLAGKWKGLGSVKISVLRTKGEEWSRGDEGWSKKA